MARLSTRTKLRIGAAVLALAAGVVLVRGITARRAVEVSFVRYADRSAVVLRLANRGQSLVRCVATNVFLFSNYGLADQPPKLVIYFDLMPRCSTNLVVWNSFPMSPPSSRSFELPATVFVLCRPQPSDLRKRIEVLLGKIGINIASTRFVVALDLPPYVPITNRVDAP